LSTYQPGSPEPLRRFGDLLALFEPAAPREGRVGAEWELLPLGPDGLRVPYGGGTGISALLEEVRREGHLAIREGRHLVALRWKGGGIVGLEPGGQLEFASPPSDRLADLERFFRSAGGRLARGARALGYGLEAWGLAPNEPPERLPDVPKVRYRVLAEHLRKTGDRGRWMMQLTASTQVSLDYVDEEHLRRATDGALRALPYLYAATANAPVAQGHPTGWASLRADIWRRTDRARCGLPPHLFSARLGYEAAARWALSRPVLFMVREGDWVPGDGRSFGEVWKSPGPLGPLTAEDWSLHVSGLFPDLRVRGYLEVRVLDSLPLPLVLGAAALLKGLLARRDGFRWTAAFPAPSPGLSRRELRRAARSGARWVPETGPAPAEAWPRLLRAAREGLRDLGDEPGSLEPLATQARSRRCPADGWVRAADGPWQGPANGLPSPR